jgi:TorA maturation chaperone TorD
VIHRLERIDRIYSNRFSRDFHFLAVGGFDGRCAVVPMASVWKEGEPESGNDIDSLQELMKDSTIELDRPGRQRALIKQGFWKEFQFCANHALSRCQA